MNNQQITKIINYFRLNHGFHSPYSFIVDGNFLKILVEKDINLQQKLKPIIPGKFKLKVTKCTVQQLSMLGHNFHFICQKAKQMPQIKCGHSFETVDKCILDNSQKQVNLIICSQDRNLRRKLRRKNIGIMYFGPDQRITMQDIQQNQLFKMKQMQRQKFLPSQPERQKLNEYKNQQHVIEKIKKRKQQYKLASTRGVELKYIKKKVLKGPNPLSVKKKKELQQNRFGKDTKQKVTDPNKLSDQKLDGLVNIQQVSKKKRIRKRNKNKIKNSQADNNNINDQ